MITLSQTTGYAILALSCLGTQGEMLVFERVIAQQTGIPKPYLSKILHGLGKAGLIVSKRGYKGGIALARSSVDISLLDIVIAVEGDSQTKKCFLGLPDCSDQFPCPMHEFWLVERKKLEKKFRDITLDKVKKFKDRGWRILNQKN